MSTRPLHLRYRLLRTWWLVPAVTAFVLAVYYILGYTFRPEAFDLTGLSWVDYLRIGFVDQFLLECATVFILLRLLLLWARVWKLDTVHLAPGSIARYLLAFLPVVLVAYVVFNPVTQTLRYLVRGDFSPGVYRDLYFYSLPIYLQYLALTVPTAYFVLVLNLVLEAVRDEPEAAQRSSTRMDRVIGRRGGMEHPLAVEDVYWFVVEDRQYFAVTDAGRYQVGFTIQELEAGLDPDRFVRLNRQVLVNVEAVQAFTPWFDGKYVVRMKDADGTEFVLSRARARDFRGRMGAE